MGLVKFRRDMPAKNMVGNLVFRFQVHDKLQAGYFRHYPKGKDPINQVAVTPMLQFIIHALSCVRVSGTEASRAFRSKILVAQCLIYTRGDKPLLLVKRIPHHVLVRFCIKGYPEMLRHQKWAGIARYILEKHLLRLVLLTA